MLKKYKRVGALGSSIFFFICFENEDLKKHKLSMHIVVLWVFSYTKYAVVCVTLKDESIYFILSCELYKNFLLLM